MRLDIDISHLDLSPEDQRNLMLRMIHGTERHFLQSMLRRLDVNGRTRIYNLFGWSSLSYYDRSTEDWEQIRDQKHQRQLEAIDQILSQSNFLDWVKPYIKNYTIRNFLGLCSDQKLNLSGFDIRIVEGTNEA